MCAIFAFSAFMYFTQHELVTTFFDELGFPDWIIYPLAVAKILGIIAILTNKIPLLKEWAYAGFFFDAILATVAHVNAGHGWLGMSLFAIVLVMVSRYFDYQRSQIT
jgi:hypothetical protein